MDDQFDKQNAKGDQQYLLAESKTQNVIDLNEEQNNHVQIVEGQFTTLSRQDKKSIFITLIISVFLISSTYLIISPFFPPLANKRNLTQFDIGLIYAIEPIASFISCFVLGKMISFWGRKTLIIIGHLFLFSGIAMFGALDQVFDQDLFFIISIVSRLLQGIGASIIYQITYSLIPNLYTREECIKKIAVMEGIEVLGSVLSLLAGGGFYVLGGYILPFALMGGLIALMTLVLVIKFPKDIVFLEDQKKPLKIGTFMPNPKVLCMFFIIILLSSGLTFLDASIANYLQLEYDLSQVNTCIVFSLMTLCYTLPLIFYVKMTGSNKNKQFIVLGLFLSFLGYACIGPDSLISNKNFALTCVGLATAMIGMGFTFTPVIPELIEICNGIQPEEEYLVCDMASGIYNAAYNIGNVIGPLYSGMENKIGYIITVRYFDLVQAIFIAILCSISFLHYLGIFKFQSKQLQEISVSEQQYNQEQLQIGSSSVDLIPQQ